MLIHAALHLRYAYFSDKRVTHVVNNSSSFLSDGSLYIQGLRSLPWHLCVLSFNLDHRSLSSLEWFFGVLTDSPLDIVESYSSDTVARYEHPAENTGQHNTKCVKKLPADGSPAKRGCRQLREPDSSSVIY